MTPRRGQTHREMEQNVVHIQTYTSPQVGISQKCKNSLEEEGVVFSTEGARAIAYLVGGGTPHLNLTPLYKKIN